MCLGVPGRILEISGNVATVDFFGIRRQIRLETVDENVAVGDYVLNHAGFAIRRIPQESIGSTLALYQELLGSTSSDPMSADVRNEIAAAGKEHDA